MSKSVSVSQLCVFQLKGAMSRQDKRRSNDYPKYSTFNYPATSPPLSSFPDVSRRSKRRLTRFVYLRFCFVKRGLRLVFLSQFKQFKYFDKQNLKTVSAVLPVPDLVRLNFLIISNLTVA